MSGIRLAASITVMTAAVLLPKAVPAALVGTRLHPLFDRFLRLVPVALLGGLVVVSATGPAGTHLRVTIALAVAVAGAVAVLTRRSLVAMISGWATLAAGATLLS